MNPRYNATLMVNARFTPSFLDEIKARLPVSEVVGRRVKLKKAGREWNGLSPFTAEKSPSFFVNDQKMAWFDFSAGKNGNIFDFLMQTEGLSFPEAVERLAQEAGLEVPKSTPESLEREKKRAGLTEVLELATQYFEAELQGRQGAKARGYLSDRALGPKAQTQFRIGYAPADRFALRDWLAQKGASVETMIEAGLLIHGEDIAVPYGRFRDRIMFPIADRNGRVIAFGGRALDKDVQAKYLNSNETPLFHKGAVLYNLHQARKAAHDLGQIILVEGYVDVIQMSLAGFPNVVASCGTALTPDQCDLLWRMAPEPTLFFDGDRAGRKAAHRAIDTALPLLGPGKSLRFAFLPDGQDPDDLARSGGQAALGEVLAGAKPLVDVLWQREVEAGQLDIPEQRAALERRLNNLVNEIKDETLKRYYRDDIRDRLLALQGRSAQSRARAPQGQMQRAQRPWQGRGQPIQNPYGYRFSNTTISPSLSRSSLFARGSGIPGREAAILLILLNHPALLARHIEELAELDCASRDIMQLRDGLTALAAEGYESVAELKSALDAAGLAEVRRRVEAVEVIAKLWCVKSEAAEIDAEGALRQALALHRRARALHKELKSVELALAEDPSEDNLARLREIQAELTTLDGREATLEGFGIMSGRQDRAL
jgi:DNA primase